MSYFVIASCGNGLLHFNQFLLNADLEQRIALRSGRSQATSPYLSMSTTTRNGCTRRWDIFLREILNRQWKSQNTPKAATMICSFGKTSTRLLGTGTQTRSLPQTPNPGLIPSRSLHDPDCLKTGFTHKSDRVHKYFVSLKGGAPQNWDKPTPNWDTLG